MSKLFVRFPGFRDKAVTLSYDDGVRQDKRLISIMQKYGLKGTFNINSGQFSDKYEGVEKGRMTLEEAKELYLNSGMEVAVHGYKHLSLGEVDTAVAMNDVITDRRELEKHFGGLITGMAYANGSAGDDAVEILRLAGIDYSRTTVPTEKFDLPNDWLRLPATCHHNNPRLMELAESFLAPHPRNYYWAIRPKLFYLWGHSYEFDNNDNWEVIERFAEFIGGKEDVWYATNGEIYKYLKAADSIRFSVDGKSVYNPSAITVYINYIGTEVSIAPGETVSL